MRPTLHGISRNLCAFGVVVVTALAIASQFWATAIFASHFSCGAFGEGCVLAYDPKSSQWKAECSQEDSPKLGLLSFSAPHFGTLDLFGSGHPTWILELPWWLVLLTSFLTGFFVWRHKGRRQLRAFPVEMATAKQGRNPG